MWVILKTAVHLEDLGMKGSVVGFILRQRTIRALATVMLFSIERNVVGLLRGMERNGSVGIAARLRLDSGNMLRLVAEAWGLSSSKCPCWVRGPPSHQGLFPQRYCSRCLNLTERYHYVGGTLLVAQLVEAPRYKPEGSGFDFSLT